MNRIELNLSTVKQKIFVGTYLPPIAGFLIPSLLLLNLSTDGNYTFLILNLIFFLVAYLLVGIRNYQFQAFQINNDQSITINYIDLYFREHCDQIPLKEIDQLYIRTAKNFRKQYFLSINMKRDTNKHYELPLQEDFHQQLEAEISKLNSI